MSLINDALKQARKAQQQMPTPTPSTAPQLHVAEPSHQPRLSLGLALPITFAGLLLLGLFLVWRVAQYRLQGTQPASPQQTASVADPVTTPPATEPPVATADPPPIQVEPVPASPSAPSAPAELAVPSTPLPPNLAPPNNPATPDPPAPATAMAQQPPATNAPVAVEPAKPALKLQAILFNPTRPSVMISGKTLFVGDRVGEYQVSEIHRDSAKLTGSEPTNVLILATSQ